MSNIKNVFYDNEEEFTIRFNNVYDSEIESIVRSAYSLHEIINYALRRFAENMDNSYSVEVIDKHGKIVYNANRDDVFGIGE